MTTVDQLNGTVPANLLPSNVNTTPATMTTPTTTAAVVNPAATVAAPTGVASYVASQVKNPTLTAAETVTPQLQGITAGEIQPNEAGITAAATPPVNASQITAAKVDPNAVTANYNGQVGQYAATTGNNVAQGQAAQGTVDPNSTVAGQLTNLYAQTANGQTPTWAQGAVEQANEAMAQRGLGASSIGAAAITAAVQASALPIASADAATYFSMQTQNLANQQQTALSNTQNRQQGLLSDQAASNAAAATNASNAQQSQQFLTSLVNSIQTNNASMAQAASQYNATEQDQVSQYNDTLSYNRAQFNAQQQYAIDQSNVLWQRTINTQNTAAVNAANQVNAQNTLNISNTALNNLWQQFMDESSWAFTASQNQNSINANMTTAANNRNFTLKNEQTSTLLGSLGAIATSLITGK